MQGKIITFFKSVVGIGLLGSILIIVLFYLNLDFENTNLFEQNILTEIYDDSSDSGNTSSELKKEKGQYCVTYVLGNQIEYPFAGLKFIAKNHFDFSSKTKLNITFSNSIKQNKIVHLKFAVRSNKNLERVFSYALECNPHKNNYEVDVKQFETPSWWFKEHNVLESSLEAPDFSKVTFIGIQNDILVEKGMADQICLSQLSISKNNLPTILLMLASLAVLFITLTFWHFTKRKKIVVEYKATQFTDIDDKKLEQKDLQTIVLFISAHYENPELSLGMIRKACKITENRISMLIKEEFTTSYTDYVHQIRISEAKEFFKHRN